MDCKKHSMFAPSNKERTDCAPILLSDKVRNDYDCILNSGFDSSGKYYLVGVHDYVEQENQVYIISYNKESCALEKKLLKIQMPHMDEYSTNWSQLNPLGATFIHAVLIRSKKKPKVTSIDFYYLSFSDILETEFQTKTVEASAKPDLSLQYDADKFHYWDVDFIVGDQFSAYLLFDERPRDLFSLHNFDPNCFVDIFHTDTTNIWHGRRVKLYVDMPGRPEENLFSEPWRYYTTDRMFFYQESINNVGSTTYEIQEFNYDGELLYSYSIERNCTGGYFGRVSKLIYFIVPLPPGAPEKDTEVKHVFRLINGKAIPDFEYLNDGSESPFINKFGILASQLFTETKDTKHVFTACELYTNKEIMCCRINDLPPDHEIYDSVTMLNWNLSELGVLALSENDLPNGCRTLFFKFCNTDILSRKMSLKYLAGRKVLTLFSDEYLLKQNIPSCLFTYLGIKST
uniref:Uncharacterized protein n=1 Tax=Clytia hemisphaerica TaxID=252671 RepID=A0A7M6DRI4_9CNID